MITGEQKVFAITAHLSYFLGGIGFVLAPLIIYLLKKDDPFVFEHAKQALVAHLVMLSAGIAVGLSSMLIVGLIFVPVLVIMGFGLIVTSLLASVKALNGEFYRYPFIQGLVEKL